MAVSLKDLQHELEAIQEHCPVLLPSSTPQGYDVEDLWGLVGTEGKAEREALKQCLQAAASQHAAASSRCCVCETAGDPCVSSSTQEDEAHALRFTVFSHLDFPGKLIQLTGGGFACGHCRALLQPHRFLHFAAMRLSPQHPERMVLAQELCAHFAATNRAPEHVQANPDALVLWLQELMSRAYALQVLASNISGWRMVGPEGTQIRQCAKGTSVHLAETLLAASRGKQSSRSQHKLASKKESMKRSKASPSPGADALPPSHGTGVEAAAADGQQQQQQTPASSGKKRKGAHGAATTGDNSDAAAGARGATAALSSAQPEVVQPEVGASAHTPAGKQQHGSTTGSSSSKKKKHSAQAGSTPGKQETPAAGGGSGAAGVAGAEKQGKSAGKLNGQQAAVQQGVEAKRKAATPGPVKQQSKKKARPSL